MRYTIDYEEKYDFKDKNCHLYSNNKIKNVLLGVIVLVFATILFTGGVRRLFFENVEEAKRALNDMTSGLKDGERVVDVIQTFCREIFDDSDVYG